MRRRCSAIALIFGCAGALMATTSRAQAPAIDARDASLPLQPLAPIAASYPGEGEGDAVVAVTVGGRGSVSPITFASCRPTASPALG